MKKLMLILAFCLASTLAIAQNGGGLFQRGQQESKEANRGGGFPGLPGHGEEGDQPAPLGAGCGLLITFGAAYALYKKKSKSK